MRHMYTSLCQVLVNKGIRVDGGHRRGHVEADEMFDPILGKVGHILCRIDLSFTRPGKDDPAPQQAGVLPDRFGVMFCDPSPQLKIGHILKCVYGPITGQFEIRGIDEVQDYSQMHHMEIAIKELGQRPRDKVDQNTPNPPRNTYK